MSPPAASSKLSPRERKRRATSGGGSRSVPAPLLAPALVATAFLVVPLAGLVLRAPWGDAWSILHGSDATQALQLSLWTSTVATAISLLVGVPLAWVLARTDFPGLRLLRALVTLPLGVLQAPADAVGAVTFSPDLPQKRDAVNNLAMGPVIKIVLRFREAFWEMGNSRCWKRASACGK
jgi:ABC-type sugar transport system permease subunit